MDKQEANERLNALEAEAAKLREIINEPEMPEIKRGDVWEMDGQVYSIHQSTPAFIAASVSSGRVWTRFQDYKEITEDFQEGEAKRLGTFDEVFVRRSEVAKLLEIKDSYGDTLQECGRTDVEFDEGGVSALIQAIKDLTQP